MTEETLEQAAYRIVQQNVHCCLSALVSTLAQGSGCVSAHDSFDPNNAQELSDLCEQASELATPVPGYEETAREAGLEVRHDMLGFYVITTTEAEHEDAGNASAGFDGRPHFEDIDEAWRAACEDLEPYDREVCEHWAVSDWLADKLIKRGEKVDKDFAGLTVWARTTTGQAISMDSVIRDIARAVRAA